MQAAVPGAHGNVHPNQNLYGDQAYQGQFVLRSMFQENPGAGIKNKVIVECVEEQK